MSRLTAILLLAVALGGVALAQVAGRLTGTLVDPSGAVIADAAVNLYLSGGKTPVLSTRTTSDGIFDFNAVRPDTYRLEVKATGFNAYAQNNVSIDPVRQTSLAPVKLDIQSSTQTVEVTSSAATVDTSTVEVSNTVTQSQVINPPVLDRQVINLFSTQPGLNTNGRAGADTAINGLRAQNTNVTLDGINVQDNFTRINGIDYIPNKLTIGEVSELTVSTSNLNPAIGGNATAISLSSTSGQNQYHGNIYWYNRNSHFAANDWFNNQAGVARPFLNLNQFGGAVGGPVKRDKLLFYVAYETYNLHQTSPKTNTILTPTARQGILQYRVNGAIQQFNVLQNPGATPAPLTIDKSIVPLLAQVPTVGNTTSVGDQLNTTGYQFNARSNNRRDSIIGKMDYNLSPKHVFSGTYRWNRDNVDRPDQGSFFTVVPPPSNQNKAKLFSASWRWTPTATLTNELRGGFNPPGSPFPVARPPPPPFLPRPSLTHS